MDLGSIGSLKELSIRPVSVFYMRFYPEDNVVPKFAGDGHRDKYFVILGKDSDGLYIALSLINSEINSNLKSRIGLYQYQIKQEDYSFLQGKDRFVDCYSIKEVSASRILELGEYKGVLNDGDLAKVIELVNTSPVISVAMLKQYSLFKSQE